MIGKNKINEYKSMAKNNKNPCLGPVSQESKNCLNKTAKFSMEKDLMLKNTYKKRGYKTSLENRCDHIGKKTIPKSNGMSKRGEPLVKNKTQQMFKDISIEYVIYIR